MDFARLHLHWTARKKLGKEYRVYSLARSFRSDGKVRKQIIFKLGKLTAEEIGQWRQILCSFKSSSKPEKTQISKMSENINPSDDFQKLIKAASKKRFDYIEADRDVD